MSRLGVLGSSGIGRGRGRLENMLVEGDRSVPEVDGLERLDARDRPEGLDCMGVGGGKGDRGTEEKVGFELFADLKECVSSKRNNAFVIRTLTE